jgi:phosphoserine phosphatase
MSTAYCFDLDGTITTLEILPCIAAELGIAGEIATLTRLTMDGHIPFTDSLRLRALILGQVPVQRVHEIIAAVPLEPSLLEFMSEYRSQCFIVTGNVDAWVGPLLQRLGCRWFCSEATEDNGRLALKRILDKGDAVRRLRVENEFQRFVAVGDGANDVSMLEAADIAIAYGGVHPPTPATIAAADLVINDPDTLCTLLKAL